MKNFLASNPEYHPCIIPAATDLVAIDFDKIKSSDAELPEWILNLAQRFNSYLEISQSHTGAHILLCGKISKSCVGKIEGCKVELLSNHPVTLTGNIISGFDTIRDGGENFLNFYSEYFPSHEQAEYSGPRTPPLSNHEIIECLSKAKNKEKFEKLYLKGDIEDYGGDDSLADLALASLIAFYTQNETQIFEIIKDSALFKGRPDRQEKWNRDSYGLQTIKKAIASLREVYQPIRVKESAIRSKRVGTWENPEPLGFGEKTDLEFPLWALPKCMQAAVAEVARFVQVDPAMAMIPALGIAGLQIGKKVTVIEKEGLEHHPSLFLLCVMDQVERKSETNNRILNPIKDKIEELEEAAYKTDDYQPHSG